MSHHFIKSKDGEQIFYSLNFDPLKTNSNILVFNYGLVCSHQHWEHQIRYFQEEGYSVLLHDYRGHFQSSRPHNIESVSFEQIAHDVKGIVDHLKIEGLIFLGHSMGVNVCLEYAKLFPSDLKALVLISGTILPVHNVMMDTHLSGSVTHYLKKGLFRFPAQFKFIWKYGGWSSLVQKIIHKGGFNTDKVSLDFIKTYLNKIGELGPELFFQLIGQMQKHDILACLDSITTKTLIIGGNMDKVIPNFLQALMHSKLSNSKLYIIHAGSHVPQVDFPEITNERIELFIKNC